MIQRHALGNLVPGSNELKSMPPLNPRKNDDLTSYGEISGLDSPGELAQDIDASISKAQDIVKKAKIGSKNYYSMNPSLKMDKDSLVHGDQDLSLSSVSDR